MAGRTNQGICTGTERLSGWKQKLNLPILRSNPPSTGAKPTSYADRHSVMTHTAGAPPPGTLALISTVTIQPLGAVFYRRPALPLPWSSPAWARRQAPHIASGSVVHHCPWCWCGNSPSVPLRRQAA